MSSPEARNSILQGGKKTAAVDYAAWLLGGCSGRVIGRKEKIWPTFMKSERCVARSAAGFAVRAGIGLSPAWNMAGFAALR